MPFLFFLPADDDGLLYHINNFRTTGVPTFLILHSGNHWTALCLTSERTYLADSLNISRVDQEVMGYVDRLIRTAQLPSPEERQALLNRHRIPSAEDRQVLLEIHRMEAEERAARERAAAAARPAVGTEPCVA